VVITVGRKLQGSADRARDVDVAVTVAVLGVEEGRGVVDCGASSPQARRRDECGHEAILKSKGAGPQGDGAGGRS
jgi:hypothetical protein